VEDEVFTDVFTYSLYDGIFSFDYVFNTLDNFPPFIGYDKAGYLLGAGFYLLTDLDGVGGSVSVPVHSGELFGFRVITLDNQGEPGILTVTNFSAPVPEPASFWLMATGALMGVLLARIRSKRGRVKAARVILGCAIFAAMMPRPARAQTQTDYTGTDITGQLRYLRTVNLRQAASPTLRLRTLAPTVEKTPKAPPPRLRPPQAATLKALAASSIIQAKSLFPTISGSVAGFNALSHFDQRNAYNGNQFSIEPPSQSVAVGNGYILEGVNDAVQVYSLTGSPVLPATVAANQLFGLGPAIDWSTGVNGVYLTDMRVYYDEGIGRFFVVQRSQDNDTFGAPLIYTHLYLAVSKTNDPAGDYAIYVMETTNMGHPGCPCLADYPQVGSDQYGFHISWNEFNSYSLTFVDAAINSFSKSALAVAADAPAAYQITIPYTFGYEFAIQPATTPAGTSPFLAAGGVEYFVSSVARSSTGNAIALWALRNTSSLSTPTRNLVLSRIFVPTLSYAFPDVATQRPGSLPYGDSIGGQLAYLDGGDMRTLSLTYAGGRLYLTMQTAVPDEKGQWVVGGAYIVLSPVFRSNLLFGNVLNQGYLVLNGNHLLRPAIAVNAQGRGAIAVTVVGPDWYPSAGVIPFNTFGTPSAVEIGAVGSDPEDGFTGYPGGGVGVARWGDYNGSVAAADGIIWMVAQYVGPYARTTYANWNTYVMHRVP
jgi:hypothetical protein